MSEVYECPICHLEFTSEISWASHYDKQHDKSFWFVTFEKILNKYESVVSPEIKNHIDNIRTQIETQIKTKKEFTREYRVLEKQSAKKKLKITRDKKLKIL